MDNDAKMMDEALAVLRANMVTGRIPVIVIGSGVSAGAGAPSMGDIHKYLLDRLKGISTPEGKVITDLLYALTDPKVESPRSVQVRLYKLLQNSEDADIVRIWNQFGVHLITLKIPMDSIEKNLSRTDSIPNESKILFNLKPSGGHRKAAELAVNGQAILISLNFDGLTRKAVEQLAKTHKKDRSDRSTARIISTPEEIRNFYTLKDEDLPVDENHNKLRWRAIPIIKFRGDVFHAKCNNGRCPEFNESTPIYNLITKNEGGRRKIVRETLIGEMEETASSSEKLAREMLECPVCHLGRRLSISFPGVFDKEQDIDKAFSAFHEIYGCGIAGIIFMGFSGRWDEALVDYLIGRARKEALDAPVFILDMKKKNATGIIEACKKNEVSPVIREITFCEGDIQEEEILKIFELPKSEYAPAGHGKPIEFPEIADTLLGNKASHDNIQKADKSDSKPRAVSEPINYKLFITPCKSSPTQHGEDTQYINYKFINQFKTISSECLIGQAINFPKIKNLESCSQLGLKGYLMGEKDHSRHNRLCHSAAASVVARLWYEALLPQAIELGNWSCTEKARTALEFAVLFHDARHLPFSHMMEEIFADLNWGYERLPIAPDVPVPYPDDAFPSAVEISEIFGAAASSHWLENIKPSAMALQKGRSGVPWLEAIVDSALDADKIEYIFNDSHLTGQNVRLSDWNIWFQTFVSDQKLTPEGLIRLQGQSAVAFFDLLQERQHLYRRLYLVPELRALECMAKYIVTTWLEWIMPDNLSKRLSDKETSAGDKDNMRGLKAKIAGDKLWEIFKDKNEYTALNEMVKELESMPRKSLVGLDQDALEWIKSLSGTISEVADAAKNDKKPSLHHAQAMYAKMNSIGPLYVNKKHIKKIRLLVRRWRTNYPLMALIDVAAFPAFLATPPNRKTQIVGDKLPVAEQYLVPGEHPSQWSRKHQATIPLHHCDFSSFEYPVLQLVVFDPIGKSSGGSDFVYQMLRRELQGEDIAVSESPEKVDRSK